MCGLQAQAGQESRSQHHAAAAAKKEKEVRYYTVTYWSDPTLSKASRQEKRFATQEAAIRYCMVLGPHFRVQIDDHDDATGG